MTKDELVAALLVERQDQTWWKTKPRTETPDDIRWRLLLKAVDHDMRVMDALSDESEGAA